MKDDTISHDPKMLEEARQAASNVNLPKITYDPKTVAKAVWEDVAEEQAAEKFEDFWKTLVLPESERAREPLIAVQEHEFRQFMVGLVYMFDSVRHAKEAEELSKKSGTLRDAVFTELNRRLKKETGIEVNNVVLEIQTGITRKGGDSCILHPNGCPKEGNGPSFLGAIPIDASSSPDALRVLTSLLQTLIPKK